MIRILLLSALLTFIFAKRSYAQASESMCDMHMHLSLKKYMQNIIYPDSILKHIDKSGKLTQVPKFNGFNLDEINWNSYEDHPDDMRTGATSDFKNYIQADYNKLSKSNYDIVCGALMPLEKNTVTSRAKRRINSKRATKISPEKLMSVYTNSSSFNEMLAEYYFLTNQVSKPFKNSQEEKGMVIVNDTNDILKARKANSTSIVITIEGGNALYGKINSGTNSSNVLYGAGGNSLLGKDWQGEILRNVDSVKNLNHRILYMGLTHFTWTRIAGHAKATDKSDRRDHWLASIMSSFKVTHKMLHNKHDDGLYGYKPKKPILINNRCNGPKKDYQNLDGFKEYYPNGVYIGDSVVRKLLAIDGRHRKPILVDVRHMDINARLHFYSILEQIKKEENRTIPIIMSHGAVSGEKFSIAASTALAPYYDRYEERRNPLSFYKRLSRRPLFRKSKRFSRDSINYNVVGKFNPWGVNLYDEEIKTIYDSNGMIGLIFYTLPLGADMRLNQSKKHLQMIRQMFTEKDSVNADDYLAAEAFIRNAFYIAKNSGQKGKKAWEGICLGSDFDSGLDPMNIAPTVVQMPDFYKKFRFLIEKYIAINNEQLDGITPDEIAKNIFHDNMERFVWKNL